MSKVTPISVREFARQIDVSESAVRKAIATGKLNDVYDNLAKKIDPVAAKKNAWVMQQKVVKPKAGVSKEKIVKKLFEKFDNGDKDDPEISEEEWSGDEEIRTDTLLSSIKVHSNLKYAEAMRRREIIALALDKMKLEETQGVLVRRDKVERALHAISNELKKALMNMPQKVVRIVQKVPTEVGGISIITDELNKILGDFGNLNSNSFK